MRKKYAAFDMDGTLIDSMVVWRRVVAEAYAEKGLGELPPELKEKLFKMSNVSGLALVKELYGEKVDVIKRDDILRLMRKHYNNDIGLKPGIKKLLETLKAEGVRMCVISATPLASVREALAANGILGYFEFILTEDEFPLGKKDPAIFKEAMKRFNAEASDIALYEDALYSMKTAKKLGLYVIGIEDITAEAHKAEIIEICDEYHCISAS